MSEKTELPANLQAVIDANVTDSPSMLGQFSPAELEQIDEAEKAGEKRKGLRDAIEAERVSRAKDADDSLAMANEAAKRAGRSPIDGEGAKEIAEENAQLKAQVEQLESDRDTATTQYDEAIKGLREQNDKLKSELAAAKKSAGGRQPAKGKVAKPRTLALGAAAIEGATTVAFTGEDGRTIPDLPELEFSEGAFRKARMGGGLELTEAIRFPQSVKKTQVSKIWLVDDKGNAAAVAQLVNPLTVGGGTNATIPANSLVFRAEGNAAPLDGSGDGAKATG